MSISWSIFTQKIRNDLFNHDIHPLQHKIHYGEKNWCFWICIYFYFISVSGFFLFCILALENHARAVVFLLEYLKKSHIGLVFNNKWTFDYHGVLLIWNFHTFWVSCGVKNRRLNISVNIYPWITTISSFEKNVIHINMMQNSGLFPH